jgi:hypothetical protein
VAPVSPLAVLMGIIMGSAVTISIGLAMVLVVFLMMGREYPTLTREYGALLSSFLLFLVLAFVSSTAFLGVLRSTRWRWYAQAATWLVVGVLALHYWPR